MQVPPLQDWNFFPSSPRLEYTSSFDSGEWSLSSVIGEFPKADNVSLTVICNFSMAEVFALRVKLGPFERGSSCNETIVIPYPTGQGNPTLSVLISSQPTRQPEFLTLSTIAMKSCFAETHLAWWIWLLVGVFLLVAVASVVLYCRRRPKYSIV